MAEKPRLRPPTESEQAILQVLWRRGPSSVRDVRDNLGKDSGYTTVLKFLQIMLEKGLVTRNQERMTHINDAVGSESDTQEQLLDALIERAFSGSTGKLVMRVLAAKSVPAGEMKMIRALIAERRARKP